MTEHYLDNSETQPFWDNSIAPRLEIESGDTVIFDCPEPCGQVTSSWDDDDLAKLDFDLVHALIGSVFVKGAEPGDTLEVELLAMEHRNWGWTGHLEGFGLLADDFNFAYIHHWEMNKDTCNFGKNNIQLPFRPFCGTMGVAPKEAGRITTIPPRENAGNVDIRDIGVGSIAWFPVLVEGALFAIGDGHSAQGDGEVCGTAIESPMLVTARLSVRKNLAIKELQFQSKSSLTNKYSNGYHATTAHGPDLMENARNAVGYMIDWLVENRGLTRSEAYCLCSTASDLKISEIVDAPNWIVSNYMPLGIFSP